MQYTALEAMYDETLPRLVSGIDSWQRFLAFSARLRRPFKESALVYAQKPTATKIADYDTWKDNGKHVQRGEKGIQVLTGKGRRFVFDIEQTDSDIRQSPLTLLLTLETRTVLCDRYRKENLQDALKEAVRQAYSQNAAAIHQVLSKIDFSGRDSEFDAFAIQSAEHMVLTRFGIPNSIQNTAVYMFKLPAAIDLLGKSVMLTALPVIKGIQKQQNERVSRHEKATAGELDGQETQLETHNGDRDDIGADGNSLRITEGRTDAGFRYDREGYRDTDAPVDVRSVDVSGEQIRAGRRLVAGETVSGDIRKNGKQRLDRDGNTETRSESSATIPGVGADTHANGSRTSNDARDRVHNRTGQTGRGGFHHSGQSGMGDGGTDGYGVFRRPGDGFSLIDDNQPESHIPASAPEAILRPLDYRYDPENIPPASGKAKYRANADAIRALKKIENEHRYASVEEQRILARFGGWGNLSQVFDEHNRDWAEEYAELKALFSPDEYAAARHSTLNAHYTSHEVISEIWRAVSNMGVRKRCGILEPAMGTGNFFAVIPDSLSGSRLNGVELDSITGRISKQLYPRANIKVSGYEHTGFNNNTFDLALSNVPFGAYTVADTDYNKTHFLIHDYFIQKTIDKLRPGGIAALITTSGTMDKRNDRARRWFAERAELLGAIRLTNEAFKKSAGTEVTTDILFFQKRERPDPYAEPEWLHVGQTEDGVPINQYYLSHPDMLTGKMVFDSSMYGNEKLTSCHTIDGDPWYDRLKRAVEAMPRDIYTAFISIGEDEAGTAISIPADPAVRNHTYTVADGSLWYREDGIMAHQQVRRTMFNRIVGLDSIRKATRAVITAQMEGISDERLFILQAALNDEYDTFTNKYGTLSSKENIRAFAKDADAHLLRSLEVTDKDGQLLSKADIFSKRTIRPDIPVTHVDSPSEALVVCLNQRGNVDIDYMSGLCGLKSDEVEKCLENVIFYDPQAQGYQTADEYLSGNVRQKLEYVRWFQENKNEEKRDFSSNVKALTTVQPENLEAGDITARIGVSWVDTADYERFIYDTLDTPWRMRHITDSQYYNNDKAIRVTRNPFDGTWSVSNKSKHNFGSTVRDIYGTERMSAYEIIECALNQQSPIVRDKDDSVNGKERYVTNAKETELAKDRQRLLQEKFRLWLFGNDNRREKYVKRYNELFNSIRLREYSGDNQTLPGTNQSIILKAHQLSAIQRGKFGGNTLLAHVVGAGKSFEMCSIIMEKRRLGLAYKICMVVPNHLTEQTATEMLRLYPSANILVASKDDFKKECRRLFFSKIATGNYDAVIMGFSQFERIPMSFEYRKRHIEEQIEQLTSIITGMEEDNQPHYSVKQVERIKADMEARLERMLKTDNKDEAITFEELGFDMLVVDEAHYYKNCAVNTKIRNVAGLSDTWSQKSADMLMKCQYINEKTNYTGIVFATGTPISNSMTEMYVMTRYLRPDLLEAQGIKHFDLWAANHGEVVSQLELAPSGQGLKMRSRFAKFYNLPELLTTFRTFADVQTAEQLKLPVPRIKTGKSIIVTSEASAYQKRKIQQFVKRMERISNGSVNPREDNALKITHEARLTALDPRILDPLAENNPVSKINQCVERVVEEYNYSEVFKGVQIIFCDQSTPSTDPSKFTVYQCIYDSLVDMGVPKDEIAFIHDADTPVKKERLFESCRSGDVRIILGSTAKMGTGTNIQDRLVALHHLDVPWRPTDVEQREGRILRQGNRNEEVSIYRYVTKGTFDAYMWSIVENKQRFISQIMTSRVAKRNCEDIDQTVLSYAEVKAIATGNPYIKEKLEVDIEVSRLQMLNSEHLNRKFRLQDKLNTALPRKIAATRQRLEAIIRDIAVRDKSSGTDFSVIVLSETFTADMEKAKEQAGDKLIQTARLSGCDTLIGNYRGFQIVKAPHVEMQMNVNNLQRIILRGATDYYVELSDNSLGVFQRMDNTLKNLEVYKGNAEDSIASFERELIQARDGIKQPFEHEEKLQSLLARQLKLTVMLDLDKREEVFADDYDLRGTDTVNLNADLEEDAYEQEP